MSDYKVPDSELPADAEVKYGRTWDGDRFPLSVSYNTEAGPRATVKMNQTADGDYIPATGRTSEGDFNLPGKKWDL